MRVSWAWILFAGLFVRPLCAQDERPEGAPKVVRIRFEGNRRYTDEFLKEQISSKEGQPRDAGLLIRDERLLREFFAEVSDIREVDVEGGVEIVFEVVDKIVVGKVQFRGLARVSKADFEPLLSTRSGRPLHEHGLRADRELLERLHREKGYHFVEVRSYLQRTKKPDVQDVVFQVLASNRIRIKEVILEGAHSIERGQLLRGVRNSDTYRRKFLGLGKVFSPSHFNRAALEQDRRLIEMHYRREGYLDARVVLVGVRFDDDRSEAFVHFRIVEGERYRVRSFKVTFEEDGEPAETDRKVLAPDALEALSVMKIGGPFRSEDLAATSRAVSERLRARAYAQNRITVRRTPVADTHEVDVRFVLRCGPKIRVGMIRIFGNRWTRDNVIRRAFREGARPGDFLNLEELDAARNRLNALRYFNYVQFGEGRGDYGLVKSSDPSRPDEYDIHVVLEEADTTRSLNVGAGVNTDGGAFGQFAVTWRNFDITRPPDSLWNLFDADAFRGGGQTFQLSLAPGTTFSTFEVSFTDPALRDSRWAFHTSIWRRISLFDDYDQTTDGMRIRVGRFLDPRRRWNLSVEWTLRQVLIDDPQPDAPVNALDVQGTSALHGLGFTITRSVRREADPFLNGYVTTIGAQFFGGFFGADVDMVKLTFSQSAGWRFLRQSKGGYHRMAIRFSVDWAAAFGDTPEVPIYERYFLGGLNLRGFDYREVGPRSNGRPTGGEFRMLLSTEYTIPLISPEEGFGLDLHLFLDQGSLNVDAGDWSSDDWRISAGFGVAISLGSPTQPPLLIDFGWPLRSVDTDQRQVVSISFARNF